MTGNKSLRLLEETYQTTKAIGEKEVISVLRQARETRLNNDNPILDCIFEVIYKEFKVAKKSLKYGTERRGGARINALRVCAMLIKQNIRNKQVDIALILNKEESDISRYLKEISMLDPKISVDRELLAKIENAKQYLEVKLKNVENYNR